MLVSMVRFAQVPLDIAPGLIDIIGADAFCACCTCGTALASPGVYENCSSLCGWMRCSSQRYRCMGEKNRGCLLEAISGRDDNPLEM